MAGIDNARSHIDDLLECLVSFRGLSIKINPGRSRVGMKLVHATVVGDTHLVLSEPLPKDAEEITIRIRLATPAPAREAMELVKQHG
jgi:hypothetical protein